MKLSESALTEVTSLSGTKELARVYVCERCGGDTFHIFVVMPGRHQHVQCADCDVSYCDGTCN